MKKVKHFAISLFILAVISSCNSSAPTEESKDYQDSSEVIQAKEVESAKAAIDNQSDGSMKADTIVINGMKFNPEELHIQKGATVVWVNEGIVPHDVTAFPDKNWTSDTIQIGQTWSKTFDNSFDYFCSIHITMKGKIIVD